MTQITVKDNFIPIVTHGNDPQNPIVDFDLLGFQWLKFRSWLLTQELQRYKTYTVSSLEEGLIDIISYNCYGTEKYWWIIALANNLADPVNDVSFNKVLIIPDRDAITEYAATLEQAASPEAVEI